MQRVKFGLLWAVPLFAVLLMFNIIWISEHMPEPVVVETARVRVEHPQGFVGRCTITNLTGLPQFVEYRSFLGFCKEEFEYYLAPHETMYLRVRCYPGELYVTGGDSAKYTTVVLE